jgi:hypothetical protein
MHPDDDIKRLLSEMRDAQREQLAEHRRVTDRLLELQQRGLAQQEQLSHLHRWLVRVGGGLLAVLLAVVVFLVLIYFLLAGWSRYLFGV